MLFLTIQVSVKISLVFNVILNYYCNYLIDAILAAMSIDFGSQYLKVGLVKPGVPMEIVLNRYFTVVNVKYTLKLLTHMFKRISSEDIKLSDGSR